MNNENIPALSGNPSWLWSEPDPPPQSGTPRWGGGIPRGAPTGMRADAGPGMPRTRLSGYEQILAARASLRAEAERAATAERWAFASPSPAPAARLRRNPTPPRRRSRLLASGLVAAPVCAVLAGLAWIEPVPTAPAARGAAPAPPLTQAAPLPAVAHRDALASAVEIGAAPDREAPRAAGSREGDDAAPDAVHDAYAAPDDAEGVIPEFVDAGDSYAAPHAAFAAVDGHVAEEAFVAPAVDLAAAGGPSAVERPSVADPVADATPAEADRSAAASLPAPPRLEHRMTALAPPPLAQGDRGPVTTRRPAPPRPARALDNDAPSAEARCRSIIMKVQLGEEASNVDRTYLQTACRARR